MKKSADKKIIIEKILGIPPDYQFNALTKSHFLQSNWHRNKLIALRDTLKIGSSKLVLDLGAGSGNFELEFSKNVRQILAVDYHPEALDFLRKKLKEKNISNVKLLQSDIRELARGKKITTKFDLIIMIDVIEHIKIDESKKLIRFFQKILKDDGQICIITPNYNSLWRYIEKILDRLTLVPHFEGQQHLAQYYPQNLKRVFENQGFKTRTLKTFNTISFLSPIRQFSSMLCRLELASNFKYGNLLLGVFEKTDFLAQKQMIKKWNQLYSQDQEKLYQNFFIRKLFDMGHRYIAKQTQAINGSILDVGSGMGYHLNFEKLSSKRRYICLDKDPKMLSNIDREFVSTIVGSCAKIPLEDKSVDAVIASHILEHLPNLKKDLMEIDRVMKKNAKLIVVLPCDPGLLWRFLTHLSPSRRRLEKSGLNYDVVMKHEHVNSFRECMKILQVVFDITDLKYFPFGLSNYNLNILCCLTLVKKRK